MTASDKWMVEAKNDILDHLAERGLVDDEDNALMEDLTEFILEVLHRRKGDK